MFSDVWSVNAALFERLVEIHSNPPIHVYYGFIKALTFHPMSVLCQEILKIEPALVSLYVYRLSSEQFCRMIMIITIGKANRNTEVLSLSGFYDFDNYSENSKDSHFQFLMIFDNQKFIIIFVKACGHLKGMIIFENKYFLFLFLMTLITIYLKFFSHSSLQVGDNNNGHVI